MIVIVRTPDPDPHPGDRIIMEIGDGVRLTARQMHAALEFVAATLDEPTDPDVLLLRWAGTRDEWAGYRRAIDQVHAMAAAVAAVVTERPGGTT